MTRQTINPRGHYLHTVRNNTGYANVADALSEFIDNSLAPNKGGAGIIYIEYQREQDAWIIADNGNGADDVRSLFQLGNTTSWDDEDDIGGYGQGATAAAIWLADEMVVVNLNRSGGRNKGSVNWNDEMFNDEIGADFQVFKGNPTIKVKGVFVSKHGLGVRLSVLHHDRVGSYDQIVDHLQFRYSQALADGKRIVVKFPRMSIQDLVPAERVALDHEVMLAGEIEGAKFTGRAGLMTHPRRNKNGAFVSYRGERVIEHLRGREVMLDKRTDRFHCEVVLEGEWKRRLNPQKTRVARYRDELCQEIYNQCQALLDIGQKQKQDLLIDNLMSDIQSQLDERALISVPGRRNVLVDIPNSDGPGPPNPNPPDDEKLLDGIAEQDGQDVVLVPDDDGKKRRRSKNGIQLILDNGSKLHDRIVETEMLGNLVTVTINTSHPDIRRAAEHPRQDLAIQTLICMSMSQFIESEERWEILPTIDLENTLGDKGQAAWRMSKIHSHLFDQWCREDDVVDDD